MAVPFEHCYWVAPGRLMAGCYPGDANPRIAREKLAALLDAGIRVFVNLLEPHERDRHGNQFQPYDALALALAAERGTTVACHRFPMRDTATPSVALVREIIDTLCAAAAAGDPVYLHCWGGRGRTGMVVGCYLIESGEATADDFVEVIAALRADSAAGGRSPDTEDRIAFVRKFVSQPR